MNLNIYMPDKKPRIFENDAWDSDPAELYNLVGIPRTYLINPEGKIIDKDWRAEKMIKVVNEYVSK